MTMNKRRWIACCIVAAIVLVTTAVVGYRRVTTTVRNAYAVWWVGDMVAEYLDNHDQQWPRDWDDLRPSFASCCAKVGGAPWSFEELRGRVAIDFSADPNELRNAPLIEGQPPFRVVYLRDGSGVHYEGAEPNTIIWRNLNARRQPEAGQANGDSKAHGGSTGGD